jgi:glycoprotein-N-acetylgalactosamine 3-beta-galactosyltransferase
MWQYIHHHYRDDYDWFLMGGDDMFIIVENMRKYLTSDEFSDVS